MNKEVTTNKMGTGSVPKVMLSMGIPMILSMVLQACYNIVDSMFVARIPDSDKITHMGEYAVNALTLAFPVQMLIVAFGIGTGVGVNIIFSNVSQAAVTSYGIFYKILQFVFFAGFGLRDAITPMVSFNYGKGDKKRVRQGIFYGILFIGIIMLIGLVGLEIFAKQLAGMFNMSKETEALCISATKIIATEFLIVLLSRADNNIIKPMKEDERVYSEAKAKVSMTI